MAGTTRNSSPAVRLVEVPADVDGQRIDNYLLSCLKGVPKSHIYRLLRTGQVRVNKGRIKPTYRVKAGDQIRIPPVRTAEQGAAATPKAAVLELVQASIIYEEPELLVLDKPAGIAVHGGSGLQYGIIEALRALRPAAPFLELVHRLDRDTSGCLIIAKKRSVLRRLHGLLRSGEVAKHYLALVKGRWRSGRRAVDLALQKNVLHSGERVVRVQDDGKQALSLFEPATIYAEASLMRVRLMTGRTHQIRVHAAHIGHPLAGDSKYGDREFNRHMRELGLKRLFLHAQSVEFVLPDSGREVHVNAPLSPDLRRVLDKLEAKTP